MHLLDLKFKGGRKYVHGTDIFNLLLDFLQCQYRTFFLKSLIIKRSSKFKLYVTLIEPSSKEKIIGIAHCLLKNDIKTFWLVESECPVTDSYEFDESLITSMSKIKSEEISARIDNNYSLIENIVSLTKTLHTSSSPAIGNDNWLFAQINLNTFPSGPWGTVSINRFAFLGNIFSRSHIFVDAHNIGEIRFMRAETV